MKTNQISSTDNNVIDWTLFAVWNLIIIGILVWTFVLCHHLKQSTNVRAENRRDNIELASLVSSQRTND